MAEQLSSLSPSGEGAAEHRGSIVHMRARFDLRGPSPFPSMHHEACAAGNRLQQEVCSMQCRAVRQALQQCIGAWYVLGVGMRAVQWHACHVGFCQWQVWRLTAPKLLTRCSGGLGSFPLFTGTLQGQLAH
jgi:hypothetical protein